ncbi:MAG: hypothetical protein AAGA46_07135 [Cyanobacteria bacterium P01_F01_bin.13]
MGLFPAFGDAQSRSSVSSVAISADGNTIVSGSSDNTVRLWDPLKTHLIGEPFEGHRSSVSSVAISADGNTIVSGSVDKTMRLWPGSWTVWLEMACNRVRYHALLNTYADPDATGLDQEFLEISNRARNTCENIWSRSDGESSWP